MGRKPKAKDEYNGCSCLFIIVFFVVLIRGCFSENGEIRKTSPSYRSYSQPQNNTKNEKKNNFDGCISTKSGVYLRRIPSAKGDKIRALANNTRIRILAKDGPSDVLDNIHSNWYKITDGKGIGWCFGGYIKEDNNQSQPKRDEDLILEKIIKEMILCTADTYLMGSPNDEKGRADDEIQHQVTLSKDFYIAKYPVTQSQYKIVMGSKPSFYTGDNEPVVEITWNKANEFCNKLNKITNSLRPNGYIFDLPTEAQWEYACRAGTCTAINNGKNHDLSEDSPSYVDEVAWHDGTLHPVGLKKPNAWDIYDMHGNIFEWCKDFYGEYNTTASNCADPNGPKNGQKRVYRGYAGEKLDNYRSAKRECSDPNSKFKNLGFRIVLVLKK